jgi:very-short-patch-repair endonuclease
MNAEFRIAERQYGLLTREQLVTLGLSTRQIEYRIETRRLEIIYPGVYRVVGSLPSARQRAMGATLWLGRGCAVSHQTAAALLHLELRQTYDMHLSAPASNRRRSKNGALIVHRVLSLSPLDIRIVDGIPSTSAARTIVDLSRQVDAEQLQAMFESARRMGLVTATTLLANSERAPAVRAMLRRSEARPLESRLEVKLARLLHTSRLPPSVAQYRIATYRVDRAWPEHRVAIEADGFRHHGQHLEWKRDRARTAAIEALGWRIVHVTWDDVMKQPSQTLDRIALSLGILAA